MTRKLSVVLVLLSMWFTQPTSHGEQKTTLYEGFAQYHTVSEVWQDWKLINDPRYDRTEWELKDGVLMQTNVQGVGSFIYMPKEECKDFVFSFEIKPEKRQIINNKPVGWLSVLFQFQDTDNHAAWGFFRCGGDGTPAPVAKTVDKNYTVFEETNSGLLPEDLGKWHVVKVVVKGKSIKCYLDYNVIYDVTDDSPMEPGGFGIQISSITASLKNLKIERISP